MAISRTVGKSSSLDLACFVQAPEGVWTRAMFGTSSTKSDSSIFIKLLASRTFFAHFALNLKWSPIVLCLKVPSRPKSFEDLIFNIYGSNWPSLSSVGHLLHIFGPLSTHKLASPNHFSTFLTPERTLRPTFEETNQCQSISHRRLCLLHIWHGCTKKTNDYACWILFPYSLVTEVRHSPPGKESC